MFWTEIEFLFYAMTKKNKNKGGRYYLPLLTNGGLLKSQTVSNNSVHTIDGILKKKDLYV